MNELLKPVRERPTADYLGDAVYAELENGYLKLTTEDGTRASNIIFLEPSVVAALKRYMEKHNL